MDHLKKSFSALWKCRKAVDFFKSRYMFYCQKIIGKYIVDFFCPKANLVIKLDGGRQYSEIVQAKDSIRNDVLRKMGIKVLRFSEGLIPPFGKAYLPVGRGG